MVSNIYEVLHCKLWWKWRKEGEGTLSPEFLHRLNIQFGDNLAQRRGGLVDEWKWEAVEIKVKP